MRELNPHCQINWCLILEESTTRLACMQRLTVSIRLSLIVKYQCLNFTYLIEVFTGHYHSTYWLKFVLRHDVKSLGYYSSTPLKPKPPAFLYPILNVSLQLFRIAIFLSSLCNSQGTFANSVI
jgi:hypothetical protein